MTTEPDRDSGPPQRVTPPWSILLLLWIVAVGGFFYIRFTFAFVFANLDAIRAVLGK